MSDGFVTFLGKISGKNSPLKTLSVYDLSKDYPNNLHQITIETLFGKQGSSTTTITENEVLSYGQRSFYLKLACLSNKYQCAYLLNYVYAAIKAEKPGHYRFRSERSGPSGDLR